MNYFLNKILNALRINKLSAIAFELLRTVSMHHFVIILMKCFLFFKVIYSYVILYSMKQYIYNNCFRTLMGGIEFSSV